MEPKDLLPFDPVVIPWPTHPNEWALCVTTEPEMIFWVEHRLIRAMLKAEQFDHDNLANIHGMLAAIGGKIAAKLANSPNFTIADHQVRAIKFTHNPLIMRLGQFGGKLFVFLPKPEFEQDQDTPEFPEGDCL